MRRLMLAAGWCFCSALLFGQGADSILFRSENVVRDVDSLKVENPPQETKKELEWTFKKVHFKPYGFIRNDFYYDSRENFETASGLFYIIPKDENLNEFGEDLNGVPSSRFLSIATRLGVNVSASLSPDCDILAKVETDFAGYSASTTMFRIRQAFLKLNWKKCSLLAGQTWHPMFGDVVPTVQSLATGSPFQPFNRSPQVRFDWTNRLFRLSFSALYQFQYTSLGPGGKASADYQVKSKVPECYLGFDWRRDGWLWGGGVSFMRIAPRTSVTLNAGTDSASTHSVDEYLNSFAANLYLQYVSPAKGHFTVKAKTIFGSNLSHLLLLSGYGVSKVNDDGSQSYTNIYNSTSWLNVTYGEKLQFGVFLGYMKNLGSDEPLVSASDTYIFGYNNVGATWRVAPMVCYNLRHWSFGVEYERTSVAYGTLNLDSGRVEDTEWVPNNRVVAVMMFNF